MENSHKLLKLQSSEMFHEIHKLLSWLQFSHCDSLVFRLQFSGVSLMGILLFEILFR